MTNPSGTQPRAFLGRGWRFPVRLDSATRRFALVEYDDDVWQAIRIILETAKGERLMRPDFGCGIHDLVFESVNDVAAQGLIASSVRDALVDYEPRIELRDVVVTPEDGVLLIEISYVVRDTNHEQNRVYPFYVGEGAQA